MSTKELSDNIIFLSALRMLESLALQGLVSEAEAEQTKKELKTRLRPTLLTA